MCDSAQTGLQDRPKLTIKMPTDAVVRITRTTICGSDLHMKVIIEA